MFVTIEGTIESTTPGAGFSPTELCFIIDIIIDNQVDLGASNQEQQQISQQQQHSTAAQIIVPHPPQSMFMIKVSISSLFYVGKVCTL